MALSLTEKGKALLDAYMTKLPSTTPERAARWPGGDEEALRFLKDAGFELGKDWNWRHPDDVPWRSRDLTEREADAMIYLQEEWDYGGYVPHETPGA